MNLNGCLIIVLNWCCINYLNWYLIRLFSWCWIIVLNWCWFVWLNRCWIIVLIWCRIHLCNRCLFIVLNWSWIIVLNWCWMNLSWCWVSCTFDFRLCVCENLSDMFNEPGCVRKLKKVQTTITKSRKSYTMNTDEYWRVGLCTCTGISFILDVRWKWVPMIFTVNENPQTLLWCVCGCGLLN